MAICYKLIVVKDFPCTPPIPSNFTVTLSEYDIVRIDNQKNGDYNSKVSNMSDRDYTKIVEAVCKYRHTEFIKVEPDYSYASEVVCTDCNVRMFQVFGEGEKVYKGRPFKDRVYMHTPVFVKCETCKKQLKIYTDIEFLYDID